MKITGLNETLKALKKFEADGEEAVKANIEAAAFNMQHEAMQRVPVALVAGSQLKNSIKPEVKDNGLTAVLVATASYAAYQEFGTGGRVSIPKGMEELARQFKGRGIKNINLAPQPFMFPAWDKERKQFVIRLQKELDRLANKV